MRKPAFNIEMSILRPGEAYGICRWCGDDDERQQEGLAIIRDLENGGEWYECGSCALAIGDCELFPDEPGGEYPADAIRRQSALLRAESERTR